MLLLNGATTVRSGYNMSFCCYNNQKLLARNGVKGVIISIVHVKARPETVLIDANNEFVVMTYDRFAMRY